MIAWGFVAGFVVYATIVGFLFLSHLGRSPEERLSRLRFGITVAVALLLPVLTVLGLPIGSSDFGSPAGGVGPSLVVLAFSAVGGFFFGSIGMVLYSVASGLPEGRTSV